MQRRYVLLLLLSLASLTDALAQYDPSFSHYWAMETSYNPAAVGKSPLLNVTAAYNMTLVGFKRNPKTVYACVNYGEAYAPDEIRGQSICINGDIHEVLNVLV